MNVVIENEYRIAFKEVLEILKFIPKKDFNKIPEEIITILKTYQDESYEIKLNTNKDFANQNISLIAKAILSIFYVDYWASDEKRESIKQKENIERKQLEEEKRRKYKTDEIFKKKNTNEYGNESNTSIALVIKKENIFQKILKKIFRK